MLNVLFSLLAGVVVGAVVTLAGFPWYAGILPGVLVAAGVAFVLTRRTTQAVQAELAGLAPLLQGGDIAGAKALLHGVSARHGRWQLFLEGQVASQLGMLDYMQLKFDEALPQLQAGRVRDWTADVAVACIHWRRDRLDDARRAFEAAASSRAKEPLVYVVWATCLARKGDRAGALAALSQGLEAIPDQPLLRQLKQTVANKRPIDTRTLPEGYLQFFPEDLAQQAVMRGRRGPSPLDGKVPVRMQQGPPAPRARGKLARRR